ncbi:hypothetical protein M2650_10180 [Luteimonas sp. SX5]|uniref:Secreted protein n=1 Tax=Luteimonas galliterrae TaxID=2940486 RepID=A0ABT0MJF8_9GAMM|nr:hypothetical protein [Luteimonas galliterrae]MCL1634995.1 hypothetical protein [Luteimonas galliterrae]
MGLFSVCLLEPIPIIGLRGCARAESYLSSMKSRPRGSARWQVARLTAGHLSARSVALSMLIVLSVSLLSGCEDAQPTQPTVRVREETTLNSGEAKAAEIQILVPSLIAIDDGKQAPEVSTSRGHASSAAIPLEDKPVSVATQQLADQAALPPTDKKTRYAGAEVPKKLHGVWSDNDAEGKIQCDRYKLASKRPRNDNDDELSISMVGSLVITKHMIHAYSEYGEGNFYAVRKVSKIGKSKWVIASLVGIDTYPSEELDDDLFVFLLDLDSTVLYWRDYDDKEPPEIIQNRSPGFFKCGQLPKWLMGSNNDNSRDHPVFPPELRGAWDLSISKCRAIKTNDSDSRIEILATEIQAYEGNENLKSIKKISLSPPTWNVVSISSVAPAEIQQGGYTYILDKNSLAISNGDSIRQFIRCK